MHVDVCNTNHDLRLHSHCCAVSFVHSSLPLLVCHADSSHLGHRQTLLSFKGTTAMAQAMMRACPFAGLLQSACETNALRGSKASLGVIKRTFSCSVRAESSGRGEEEKVHPSAGLGFSIIASSLLVGDGGVALAVTAEEVAGAFNTVRDNSNFSSAFLMLGLFVWVDVSSSIVCKRWVCGGYLVKFLTSGRPTRR